MSAVDERCSSPRTPRRPAAKCQDMPPPAPAPRENQLLAAIRSNCPELVAAALDEDEMLVHVPCHTADGCETPLLVAARVGCPAVLGHLLRSGASVQDADAAGRTALEIVAAVPDSRPRVAPGAAWADGTCWRAGLPDLPGLGARLQAPLRARAMSVALGVLGQPDTWQEAAAAKEARRCACARLLLAHGAGRVRDGAAAAAAAWAAEDQGDARLASLIRHWPDIQTLRWLRRLRPRRAAALGGRGAGLLECPSDVWELVCEALAPREDPLVEQWARG
uniref:Uncharacterized protein n=1 Tax=Alexandrium catenella TaxID=2925 RepID=A0A7S1RBJ2_ALECA|mmetsp:Transcript_51628/g.138137  ORF Transcript_51628/g.138137 Transcript_51628/m.138137 type:complete len:278 (+) Transcript_51628:123-956(+)